MADPYEPYLPQLPGTNQSVEPAAPEAPPPAVPGAVGVSDPGTALDAVKTGVVDPIAKAATGAQRTIMQPLLNQLPPGVEYAASQLPYAPPMQGPRALAGQQQFEAAGKAALDALGASSGTDGPSGYPDLAQDSTPREVPAHQFGYDTGGNVASKAIKFGAELPLWWIPGFEGAGLVGEFATQGAAFEMAREGGKPTTGALAGGALGALGMGGKAVAGAVGDAAQWAKGFKTRPTVSHPLAVSPRDEVPQLARALLDAPIKSEAPVEVASEIPLTSETGTVPGIAPKLEAPPEAPAADPNKTVATPGHPVRVPQKDPSGYILDVSPEGPVLVEFDFDKFGEVVHRSPKLLNSFTPEQLAKIGAKRQSIATVEAKASPDIPDDLHDLVMGYDELRREAASVKPGMKPKLVINAENNPGLGANRDTLENGVVVMAWDDGTVRLHQINSPELKRESLRARNLVSVRLPDGSNGFGFWNGYQILPPDPGEGIVGGITEALDPKSVGWAQVTKDADLDAVIGATQKAKAESVKQELVQQAVTAQPGPPKPLPEFPPPEGPPPGAPPSSPPGGGGGGAPMQPELPEEVRKQDAMERWIRALPESLRHAMGNVGKKVGGILVHNSLSAPRDAARVAVERVAATTGAHGLIEHDALKLIFNKDLAALPKPQQLEFEADLKAALLAPGSDGAKSIDLKWGQLAKWKEVTAEKVKQGLADRQQLIRELGGLPEMSEDDLQKLLGGSDDERAAATQYLKDYLFNGHLRFALEPGQWAKVVAKDTAKMEKFRTYVRELEAERQAGWATWSERQRKAHTDAVLRDLLGGNDLDNLRRANKSGSGDSMGDWTKSFIARKDLDPRVREILGETSSGSFLLAKSVARQQAAIANLSLWAEVASHPPTQFGEAVFVPPGAPDPGLTMWGQAYRRIPSVPHLYGKAAGGLLHPAWVEAVWDAPSRIVNIQNAVFRVAKFITGWSKAGETLYSPSNLVNQTLGNIGGILLSGTNFAPWQVTRHIRGMAADRAAYLAEVPMLGGNKLAGSVAARRFMRARELDVSGGSLTATELKLTTNFLLKQLEHSPNSDFIDIVSSAYEAAKRGHNAAASLMGLPDEAAKYSSWTGLLEKGGINLKTGLIDTEEGARKAASFLGIDQLPHIANGSQAMERLVEREAVLRVWESFSYMNRTTPVIQTGQKYGLGVSNKFIGIQSELARTWSHVPRRIATEPGFSLHVANVAATGAAFFAVWKGLSWANGISQDAVNLAWAREPQNTQWLHPAATAVPWRDSEGRVQFYEAGAILDFMKYLQGDPSVDPARRVIGNVLKTPFEGGLLDPQVTSFLQQVGLPVAGSPQFAEQPLADPLARGVDQALRSGFGGPLTPVVRGVNTYAQTAGNQGPYEAQSRPHFTPGQAAVKTFGGLGVIPASSETVKGLEEKGQVGAALRTLGGATSYKNEGKSLGMVQGKRSIAADAVKAAGLAQDDARPVSDQQKYRQLLEQRLKQSGEKP